MPYCSIQEAWGESFFGEKSKPDRFSKIVPEFANPGKLGYYKTSYPETDVYDEEAKSVYCKDKKKKIKRRKSFSRSYNRLPEHSGPKTRLLPKKSKKQRRLIIDDRKTLVESETLPNYSNRDAPINQYDLELEQDLNSGNRSDVESEVDNNIYSESEDYLKNLKSKEHFETKESYVNYLMKENKKLKKIIESFKTTNSNDNIFDLVLFISTGVFIIFLLDTVSKGIRRF